MRKPDPAEPDRGKLLVLDALVVAPCGQRVVAQNFQMRTQTLQHGRQDDWRDQAACPFGDAGETGRSGIQNMNLICVALCEVFNPLRQWTACILSLEDEQADPWLNQFERTVEEIGCMNWAGTDPLHFFKNAHAVIVSLGPSGAGAGKNVIFLVLDLLRECCCAFFKVLLNRNQKFRELLQLGDNFVEVWKLAAFSQQCKHDQQGLQVKGFRGCVVLRKIGEVVVGIKAKWRILVSGKR